MDNSLLIRNIRHLVTCDRDDRILQEVNLYIEDGVIAYIGHRGAVCRPGHRRRRTWPSIPDWSIPIITSIRS